MAFVREALGDPAATRTGNAKMRIARMLSLASLVGIILLIATGGRFHWGILMAIVLAFLIGLIEPSTAK